MRRFQAFLSLAPLLATVAVASTAHAAWNEYGVDIDVSYYHSCAVTSCGEVLCWGLDSYGQSGDRPLAGSPNVYADVTTGFYHTCAIDEDQDVECWGQNTYGQSTVPWLWPAWQIDAGGYHTCMLDTNGFAECWGYNGQGQTAAPVNEIFFDISAGAYHTCGVTNDSRVLCWGSDTYGESFGHADLDEDLLLPGEHCVDVEASNHNTCALTDDGLIYCWGRNNLGQLYEPNPDWAWAEIVPGFYRATWGEFEQIVVGTSGSCGVDEDAGTPYECWGSPFTSGGAYTPPAIVPTQVAFGAGHGCYIDGLGAVRCWGHNSNGKATPPVLGGSCFTIIEPTFPHGPGW